MIIRDDQNALIIEPNGDVTIYPAKYEDGDKKADQGQLLLIVLAVLFNKDSKYHQRFMHIIVEQTKELYWHSHGDIDLRH
jgi:hypothetical protein